MSYRSRALACAPLLLAVPAHAQDEPRTRPDIVVTAAAETEPEPQPGGTDVVLAADYADTVAVSLRDALAFSPGVYTQPRYGQEVRISVRGSGIGRGAHLRGITLLQDGVPINLADGAGDFLELDPLLLDRIEVTRGANAMLLGGATLGGAINGVTPTGRGAPGVRVRVDGGGYDTLRGIATVGVATARGDALLALSGDTSAGDRENSDREGLRFNGNIGLRLTDDIETRLYATVQRLRQRSPGSVTRAAALTDPGAANPAALANEQARNVDSLRFQSRTDIALGDASVTLGGFVNAKTLDHPVFQVLDQKSTDGGGFVRATWTTGPFDLAAGAIARVGETRARRFLNNGGRRGAITFRAVQDASTIDVNAEARWRPAPSLTLIAGANYAIGARSQTAPFPTPARGRVRYDSLSPRLGILFDPDLPLQLYVNYSRSNEIPPLAELAQIASFVPLAQQRGWTAEAGARGAIGPATFDIAAYRSDLRGELLQFTVSPSIPAASFNADRTRHQGVEAALDFRLTPWALLRQVYTYSDFTFRDDAQYGDNRLPVVPRHFYRGELRIGDADTYIAPRVEWVPEAAWADYRNTSRTSRYALLGVTAAARVSEDVSLFLDARNLTGTRAIGDVAAVVGATATSTIYYPVERRAFYAGVRAGF